MYGLFGILWMGRRWRPEFRAACDDDTVRLLIVWFFLCIALTWFDIMPVANVAHGAGMVFGVVYGLAIYSPRHRKPWIALAVAASALVLATMIACPGYPLYEQHEAAMHHIPEFQILQPGD